MRSSALFGCVVLYPSKWTGSAPSDEPEPSGVLVLLYTVNVEFEFEISSPTVQRSRWSYFDSLITMALATQTKKLPPDSEIV